jgi:hypothetical protein
MPTSAEAQLGQVKVSLQPSRSFGNMASRIA